ncbi:MAG TPA: NAD-binding protein, partial [Gemmataceae bacterium]|nr:NAD-binding protein [Gemmataceae bacterium]
MGQPFILCGLGRVGWHVLEYLQSAGLPVVVIDTRCLAHDPRLKGARLVTGDFRDRQVLEEAGVPDARGVVILSKDDLINIGAALMVRQLNAEVRIVIRLFNQNLVNRLGKTFHNTFALSTSTLTAPLFALTALTGQTLGSVRIDSTSEGLLQVVEVPILAGSNLIGRTVAEIADNYDVLVVACQDRNAREPVLLNVNGSNAVNAEDRLVVCGTPHAVARLLEGDDQAFTGVRWAGWFRRMGRVVWQTFADVDLSVKVCTGVLVGVICLSTLTLY